MPTVSTKKPAISVSVVKLTLAKTVIIDQITAAGMIHARMVELVLMDWLG